MLKKLALSLIILSLIITCSDNTSVGGGGEGKIHIGVIREAGGTYVLQRLNALASDMALLNSAGITELTYRQISSDFDPDSLSQFDIIYLAEDWAVTSSTVYENISANKNKYLSYLQNGSALYSDQPNPYDRLPNGEITIDFLPDSFTVSSRWTNEETTILDHSHYITSAIDSVDMPWPADQIANLPAIYTVLAEGSTTGYPALFVQEYGQGKILFCMGSASYTAIKPFTNEVHLRMLSWLVQ